MMTKTICDPVGVAVRYASKRPFIRQAAKAAMGLVVADAAYGDDDCTEMLGSMAQAMQHVPGLQAAPAV